MPLKLIIPGRQQADVINAVVNWHRAHSRRDRSVKDWKTVSGYAGTGKTSIIPNIINGLGIKPSEIEMVCMTAIAAYRMTQKVKAMGINKDARTVHDFIYRPAKRHEIVKNPDGSIVYDDKGNPVLREKLHFDDKRVSESKRARLKLIIFDEFSMATPKVLNDLLALDIPILLFGDLGQLPAIEQNTRVRTPIDLKRPDHQMTEIYRQGVTHPILWLSEEVRKGNRLVPGTYGANNEVTIMTYADFHKDPARRDRWLAHTDQIICAKNDTRIGINDHVRAIHGRRGLPQVGDRLICLKNERLLWIGEQNLINGLPATITDVVSMDVKRKRAVVELEIVSPSGAPVRDIVPISLEAFGNHLTGDALMRVSLDGNLGVFDYAYTMTNHKAQGNEWDNVIVLYEYLHGINYENWMYPAMTRAGQHLLIVI